jgi:hypothetical protein
MTEPSASQTTSPWSVIGDKAAKLTRLHRAQLLACKPIPPSRRTERRLARADRSGVRGRVHYAARSIDSPGPKVVWSSVHEQLPRPMRRPREHRAHLRLGPKHV